MTSLFKHALWVVTLCLFTSHHLFSQTCTGDILLASQTDVDNFVSTHGCTIVDGTLRIRSDNTPHITNLNGLATLQFVTGNLEFENNPDLTSLAGLNSLDSVGALLIFTQNPLITNLDDLSNLLSIGGLGMINNNNLSNINGLAQIDAAPLALLFSSNPALTSLAPLSDITTTNVVAISSMNGLTALEGLNGLTNVNADCTIGLLNSLTDISALSNLQSVGNDFQLLANPMLSECCPIYDLINTPGAIGGATIINGNNTGCETAAAITTCTNTCTGNVILSTQTDVDDFLTNYGCNIIDGNLTIQTSGTPAITNLNTLSIINYVSGSVFIQNNPSLNDISGLSNLDSIGSGLFLGFSPLINDVNAFTNLQSIQDLGIVSMNGLSDLNGFANIQGTCGNLGLAFNSQLMNLSGLNNLQSAATVSIQGMPITSLDGLTGLTTVGTGGLMIAQNTQLIDISALSSLNFVDGEFALTDNPVLSDCCPIFNLINTPGSVNGPIIIQNNQTGCDSPAEVACPTDSDGDGVLSDVDCDDGNPNVYPGAPEICDGIDNNCDGIVPADELDADGDGQSVCLGDCDDSDNTIFAGAPEICDGIDNNCDGVIPADELDADGDGQSVCQGDCDDSDNTIFAGAPEICDGIDNNCDGVIPADELDADGDGQSVCQGDCDDSDNTIFTGAPEICDGIDNNCDGIIPADELDADGDGQSVCQGDCDDSDNTIFAGAPEICDGIDNNCDGVIPADELDADGDGQSVCQGDCDDSDNTIFAGAPEICDGFDNNCDGVIPADELDADGDGQSVCQGDCDDSDNTIFAGTPEICDGIDNNCDGVIPADELDADGDGLSTCQGDCNDNDNSIHPGAIETCDGQDNNCDGIVDEELECYCPAYASSTQYEWIETVELENINNNSGDNGGYGDYTSLNTDLATGESYPITLTPGFSGSNYWEYWSVWIDFNNDNDFEDAGELVFNTVFYAQVNGTINVPATATLGSTRMRIAMQYGGYASSCGEFAEGEVEDYTIHIVPCDNIVDGGLIGDDELLCEGNYDPSVINDMTSPSGGSGGIEYRWLKNTSNSTLPDAANLNGWQEIPNSNSASYDPNGISETTYYIRSARRTGCNSYTGFSNLVTKTVQLSCTYCDAQGNSTFYEWIRKVRLQSINNNSGDDGGYADYTNLSASLFPGNTYLIRLRPGFSGQSYREYWRVWIDWNQDGNFDDQGELEVQANGYGNINRNFTVPANALTGSTRMRVAMQYNDYAGPCETFDYGEVEDYTIEVLPQGSNLTINDEDQSSAQNRSDESIESLDLNLYPNPATDVLHINIGASTKAIAVIKVFNSLGQELVTQNLSTNRAAQLSLDVSHYGTGTYRLVLKVGEEWISKSFVIMK